MVKMKNSGIDWIGEIPEDWKVLPIKYMKAKIKNAFVDGPFGSNLKSEHFVDNGDVYVIESGMVTTGKFKAEKIKTITETHFKTIARSECKENDVIIAKIGAKFGIGAELPKLDKKSVVSGNSLKITLNQNVILNYIFINYLGLAKELGGYCNIVKENAQPAISLENLNNIRFPVPPLNTQKRIVDILEPKCEKIESLKNDIEKQIETMEQYKKSVITETVTKGIKPDVKIKDSGIEWIGEIPEHWQIHPIYYYFEERKHKNSLCKEQNLLSLSYGNVIRKDINALGGLLPESFNTYNIIEKDDIVIRPTDLQNDKRSLRTGLCKEHGIITSAYITLMPKKNVNSQYFHYLLHSYDIEKVFYNMGNGVRQGLNYSEFKKLLVISPTIEEQKNIVNYLDSKCSSIDNIITSKKQQLEKLEEYKKSLIFEYVTGKKEVK